MEEIRKSDSYVRVFMGTTYDLGRPETIGELRSVLERIAADLPKDENLKIGETKLQDGKITYTLKEGIVQ